MADECDRCEELSARLAEVEAERDAAIKKVDTYQRMYYEENTMPEIYMPGNPLDLFVSQFADKDDDYEIWGGTERPGHVLSLGFLREGARLYGMPDTA